MMRAPCTGPCTARASRLWWRSSSASPAAAAGLCARKATVGPEPETIPAIAPQASPRPKVSRRPGASSIEARCRSLTRTRLRASASPLRSAVSIAGIHGVGFVHRHAFGRAQPVQGPENLRGGQAEVGGDQDPVRLGLDQGRREVIAHAEPDGGAAEQREGDVGAEFGGQVGEFVAGQSAVPQRVAGQQGGGGVGRPAAHAAGHRHPFGDLQVDAGGVLRDVGHDGCRLVREVAVIERNVHAVKVQGARVADADGDLAGVGAGGGHFFVE